MPECCDLLGWIGPAPVIHATDLGESPYSEVLREVAFVLPGETEVRRTLLDRDCVIPRHRSGIRLPENHPLKKCGYYLVMNISSETFPGMTRLQDDRREDGAGEEWKKH